MENRIRVVTGLFQDRHSAERTHNALTGRGYGKDDVNLVISSCDEAGILWFLVDVGMRRE